MIGEYAELEKDATEGALHSGATAEVIVAGEENNIHQCLEELYDGEDPADNEHVMEVEQEDQDDEAQCSCETYSDGADEHNSKSDKVFAPRQTLLKAVRAAIEQAAHDALDRCVRRGFDLDGERELEAREHELELAQMAVRTGSRPRIRTVKNREDESSTDVSL